jgi:hypothetical protein
MSKRDKLRAAHLAAEYRRVTSEPATLTLPAEVVRQVEEALTAVTNTDDHADAEVRATVRAALAALRQHTKTGGGA